MAEIILDPVATQARRELDQVAELIRRCGWCQHELKDSDGRLCLLGALGDLHGRPGESVARLWLYATAGTRHLGEWNDRPGRTVDEVLDLLKRAGPYG